MKHSALLMHSSEKETKPTHASVAGFRFVVWPGLPEGISIVGTTEALGRLLTCALTNETLPDSVSNAIAMVRAGPSTTESDSSPESA